MACTVKNFLQLAVCDCQNCMQVLIDTKAVQKEINLLTGKLDRIFAVTDELIFRVRLPTCS